MTDRDLSGKRFGRWVVQSRIGVDRNNSTTWLCLCDCGTERVVSRASLSARSTSCGCRRLELLRRGRGGDPLNWLFSNYRKEAKNRELPFELTREQFKTFVKQACHYCGIEPRLRHFSTYDRVGGATHAHANGIDRRDNTIGYTLANSVACCTVCNLAKSSLPVEDFEQWILRAAKHIQSRG